MTQGIESTHTGSLPVLDETTALSEEDIREVRRRFADNHRSTTTLERALLQGDRIHSLRDLTTKFHIPERLARIYWRSLGFAPVDENTLLFTDGDADAISALTALVEDGTLTEQAFISMTRGLGYHMGRLAMWITEALVDEEKDAGTRSDAEARQAMLDALPELLGTLESQVQFTFSRQLAAYALRAGSEKSYGQADERFPLMRAIGFADLVQFTRLSQGIGGEALAEVVAQFEAVSRDIISLGGGRVVKTVGDEIMFLADTPQAGAEIALSLAEAISDAPDLPSVRVGLCWGSMFSRYGDVFGPTVNRAARLQSRAQPGTVLIDQATAEAVESNRPGAFTVSDEQSVELHGIGEVTVMQLGRGDSQTLVTRL